MVLSGSTLQTHHKFDFDYIAIGYLLSYPAGPFGFPYQMIGFCEMGHIGNTLTGNSSFYMELTVIRFLSND